MKSQLQRYLPALLPALVFFNLNATAQTWSALSTGMDISVNTFVYALTDFNSKIFAGGSFLTAGGSPAKNIAQWNGTAWSQPGTAGVDSTVRAFTMYKNKLYVGGYFANAGGNPASYVARWNDTAWSAAGTGIMGNGKRVYALDIYTGFSGVTDLFAGGFFTQPDGNPSGYIVKWDGTTWLAVGTGTNLSVNALCVYNGNLYAGGNFTTAGGSPVNHIAKWDGATWTAVGTGVNYDVRALAVYNGELYAGGTFTTAGGNPANHIAKWNGTTWSAVGAGTDSIVYSLAVYNSELVAGGSFQNAGGSPASFIAKWDGTNWSTLGTGTNHVVLALHSFGTDLYAGGMFTIAGGNTANYVAKWNAPPIGIETRRIAEGVTLYPNPGSGKFVLQISGGVTAANLSLEIYDQPGRSIYTTTGISCPGNTEIDLGKYPKGIYFYRLKAGSELIKTGKVVVE